MEYTIQKLAHLSGVSTRTLRYYDQIGLLAPARRMESGYRIYGDKEVDALQQILFYRELGLELSAIKEMMESPEYDSKDVLRAHLEKLKSRRNQIDMLIENVTKTILREEGKITMTDAEKFKGFKEKMIQENENRYGSEIREKYGDWAVEESNKKMMNLTEEEYQAMEDLGNEIKRMLNEAVSGGISPKSDTGKKLMQMHKEWLSYTWKTYSKEAHIGLVKMYTADERFTKYYDESTPGCAEFLKEAVLNYAE